MSATQSPMRRYAVVQESEWVRNKVIEAVEAHSNLELDLYDESGMIHVEFELTNALYEPDLRIYIGTTTDYRTINLHIPKDGEVYALLPN